MIVMGSRFFLGTGVRRPPLGKSLRWFFGASAQGLFRGADGSRSVFGQGAAGLAAGTAGNEFACSTHGRDQKISAREPGIQPEMVSMKRGEGS